MKYAESDPTILMDENNPHGSLFYPFAQHDRLIFWIVDRIRRHRALSQCSIFLKHHPEEEALTMEPLQEMTRSGEFDNIIGTDAYWSKRKKELCATFQHKGFATAFMTLSFADNDWTISTA